MFLVKKNFINLKEEKIQDKYKILILCLMPVFLIVGTAVSELAIISLCLIFIYEFFIKKITVNNNIFFFLFFIYFCLIIILIFSKILIILY